ncbi:MAG: threonine synthase [Gammaproteobacteria bacterium]|nr:threonine synthase [Gammaproteobacteria bacterium]
MNPPSTLYQGLIERYRARLPIASQTKVITLCEGNTALIPLDNLARAVGHDVKIYAKFEGLNPTGSFKDRGMTMAVTQAVSEGSRAIICASTGNTSASAAAYAARAGIRCFVLIPEGKIALGKLAQAMIQGSVVIQIKGNFDDGMRIVKEMATVAPVAIVNSINPYRLQGQKTAAFEIVDVLGRAPDYHCIPVGNAGNISAYWVGFSEYAGVQPKTAACGYCTEYCAFPFPAVTSTRPVMVGYQAAGSAPFIAGHPIAEPETVATAIRIGNPQSWDLAWAAVRESGGWFDSLTDAEILAAQRTLAATEGVFCEPASAIAVAGLVRDLTRGKIRPGSLITCTLTGHGLKDPDTAIKQSGGGMVEVPADSDAVKRAILDNL